MTDSGLAATAATCKETESAQLYYKTLNVTSKGQSRAAVKSCWAKSGAVCERRRCGCTPTARYGRAFGPAELCESFEKAEPPNMPRIEDTYAASKSDGLDEYDQPRKIAPRQSPRHCVEVHF